MPKIVNFHRVDDGLWFDHVICFLKSRFELLTMERLEQCHLTGTTARRACHITVDDGDRSFYEVIFPVLKKRDVPASIYVSPMVCEDETNYWFQEVQGYDQIELKRIIADTLSVPLDRIKKYGSDSILKTQPIVTIHEIISRYLKKTRTGEKGFQNMSVANLKEVDRSGLITIGAHTVNHPILSNEDDKTSNYEISESIDELSALLGHEVRYFAYPNGIPTMDFGEREQRYLKNAGVRMALTTESRNISTGDDPTRIPRIGISGGEDTAYFRTKLTLSCLWGTLARLKRNGEFRERLELDRIVSSANRNQ